MCLSFSLSPSFTLRLSLLYVAHVYIYTHTYTPHHSLSLSLSLSSSLSPPFGRPSRYFSLAPAVSLSPSLPPSLFFFSQWTYNNVAAVQNQIIADARARRGRSVWERLDRRLGNVSSSKLLSTRCTCLPLQKSSIGPQVCRTCPSRSVRARVAYIHIPT